ncbi:MAG: peptidase [Deltaproteobacteria bacterium]|nr:peptidase [Deltaproteobacteria bacterium]
MAVRAWLLLLVIAALGGCPHREPGQPRRHAPASDAGSEVRSRAAPSRLADGVTPLSYDLRLELDPDADRFTGRVEIRVRLDAPTDHVWLHLEDLELDTATFRTATREGVLARGEDVAVRDQPMRAFGFGTSLPAGEVTLTFGYVGQVARDDEGLFRRQAGGRWFLYSQAESMFARRILPCFDEPRFKPAWRVTLVVPDKLVALGNGPLAIDVVRADGRHEVTLAEITAMPSYLFAVAVGPFTLLDAGRVGRAQVPVRVAVAAGDVRRSKLVVAKLSALVDALERYTDRPLPLAKLDLVAVPRFFGAMENVGLVTIESSILVGEVEAFGDSGRFTRFAAHELAHQWFGNLVTPAWWDDLWLAEGFATWLGDKISIELGGTDDPGLRTQLARLDALGADDADDARPMRHAMSTTEDADDRFDAISYEKAGAVLGMFERFVGEDRFREVIRAYLRDHAGATATSNDFVSALGTATTPAVATAFTSFLEGTGAPIVELAVRCGASPALELHARKGAMVPVCVRHATGRACAIVGESARIALPTCTGWIAGNAGGDGYYRVAVPTSGTSRFLSRGEQLAHADDIAAALFRHELGFADASRELATLAAAGDPASQLAALAIAGAIDPLIDDTTRPVWSRWLAARFQRRLGKLAMLSPRSPVERELRDRLARLLPADRFDAAVIAGATAIVDGALHSGRLPPEFALALAAPRGGRMLFDRLVAAAAAGGDERQDSWLASLGAFGPELASRLVELATDARARPHNAWSAIVAMQARPGTRTAAWVAIRERLPALLAQPADELTPIIEATGALCDPVARAEVAAAFEGKLDDLAREHALVPALAAIDRCIARRTQLGDLAAALR